MHTISLLILTNNKLNVYFLFLEAYDISITIKVI